MPCHCGWLEVSQRSQCNGTSSPSQIKIVPGILSSDAKLLCQTGSVGHMKLKCQWITIFGSREGKCHPWEPFQLRISGSTKLSGNGELGEHGPGGIDAQTNSLSSLYKRRSSFLLSSRPSDRLPWRQKIPNCKLALLVPLCHFELCLMSTVFDWLGCPRFSFYLNLTIARSWWIIFNILSLSTRLHYLVFKSKTPRTVLHFGIFFK